MTVRVHPAEPSYSRGSTSNSRPFYQLTEEVAHAWF